MIEYRMFRPTTMDHMGLGVDERQCWLVHPCTRTRNAEILAESNFRVALDDLGGESDTVEVHRLHQGHGWFEIMLINPADWERVRIAEEHEAVLENYPVLSDSDYSARLSFTIDEYWRRMSLRERIELCLDNGVSMFAARHDHVPGDSADPGRRVYDRIRYWVNEPGC